MASITNETLTPFANNASGIEWGSVTSNATTPEVVPYIHCLVAGVFCCLVALIGLPGNCLVIVSVILAKKLRTTTNIMIINLAVADFLTCAILPFHAVGLLDPAHEYTLPEFFCWNAAGVQYICVSVSIASLSAIALVRWYVISRSVRGHRGLNTPRRLAIVAAIIWAVSVALVVVPVNLEIGELGYSTYYSLCSTTDDSPVWFSLIQSMFILINLIMTGVFYVLILSFVLRHNRELRNKMGSNGLSTTSITSQGKKPIRGGSTSDLMSRRELELTKNLFLVVCIFVLCWLPNVVTFSIPGMDVSTVYCALIGIANSAVNPIIYGLRYPNFREVFKNIFLCRRINARPLSSSSMSSR